MMSDIVNDIDRVHPNVLGNTMIIITMVTLDSVHLQ